MIKRLSLSTLVICVPVVVSLIAITLSHFYTYSVQENQRLVVHKFENSIRSNAEAQALDHLATNPRLAETRKAKEFLRLAILHGQARLVKKMIESNEQLLKPDKNGNTIVHHVAFGTHPNAAAPIIELALEKGADLSQFNHYGMSPIHVAAYRGESDIVALLLELGVNPDAPTMGDENVSLHFAAMCASVEVARVLVAYNANSNIVNQKGQTPSDIVKVLIQNNSCMEYRDLGPTVYLDPESLLRRAEALSRLLEFPTKSGRSAQRLRRVKLGVRFSE